MSDIRDKEIDEFIDRYWGVDTLKGESEAYKKHAPKEKVKAAYNIRNGKGLIINQPYRNKLGIKTWIELILFVIIMPVLLYVFSSKFHGRNYLMISLIILFMATVPFFIIFEGRRPQARELMVIAVMAAVGVAGRAAFFMVPSFKPVAAIVILTGVSLGGEAGFIVGSLTMLVSNMFFGQGPWTPWQMFSYGMIGFFAGVLFKRGILKANRVSLCIYGVLSVFFIFGGIMNPASILMSYGYITWESLIAFYISGAPLDIVQAVSTAIFLIIISRPILEKLERIKIKYGL